MKCIDWGDIRPMPIKPCPNCFNGEILNNEHQPSEYPKVVYIEYDRAGRPSRVMALCKKRDYVVFETFDFSYSIKYSMYSCYNSGSGGNQSYISELVDWAKQARKKYKVWFDSDYRPVLNEFVTKQPLTDEQINKLGWVIMKNPKHLDDIISAIKDNY